MKWRSTTPSSRATLLLTRNGSQREVTVTLGEAAAVARDNNKGGDADGQTSLGVTVAPLTRERAQALGLSVNSNGLEVRSVEPDSRAAAAGIQARDVIEEVNQQPVRSLTDLQAAIRKGPARPLLVLINRAGQEVFLTARVRCR